MGDESRSPGNETLPRHPISQIRSLAFVLVFSLLFSACDEYNPDAGRKPIVSADTLTVMWYNTENLFDYALSGREYPDYVPDSMGWSYDVYLKSLDNISEVIAAANPDLVGLCEIENKTVLKDLVRMLRLKQRRLLHYQTDNTPLRSTTHTALLSRFPIQTVGTLPIPQTNGLFTRSILECDVLFEGGPLKVFTNHWPSKAHPESARMSTARVLRRRLRELPSDCDYVILGDLNENYDECETIHLEADQDSDRRTALSHVLGTVLASTDGRICHVTKKDIVSPTYGKGLYNLWWEVPDYRRWNYVYRRRRQTPDHILLPHALFDTSGWSYLDGSFSVFRWGGRLLFDGVPYRKQRRWHNGARYHTGKGYSDHLPLLAKLVSGGYCGSLFSGSSECRAGSDSIIGFESGYEGWIAGNMPFLAELDSVTAHRGRRSLRITGVDHRSRTVAKTRLIPGVMGVSEGSSVILHLMGSGNLLIRYKTGSSGWRYVSPTDPLTVHRSGRYTRFQSPQWERVRLALPVETGKNAPVDIEIRAKANHALDLRIDDVCRQ